jgi:hypothetical protein
VESDGADVTVGSLRDEKAPLIIPVGPVREEEPRAPRASPPEETPSSDAIAPLGNTGPWGFPGGSCDRDP